MDLQKNLMKMGMIQEVIEEAVGLDSDELSEEGDEIIDGIINKIEEKVLGKVSVNSIWFC
jgi:hypothetical protein